MKKPFVYTFLIISAYIVYTASPLHVIAERNRSSLNVVLITLDTTREDHFGCYGYKRNTTPHIDAFAKEAVLFSHAVSVIPLTTPSHASIMTGLHPHSHHVFRNSYPVHSDFTMLAEILNRQGYATGGFVSVKIIDSRIGFAQGFDYFSDVPEPPDTGEKSDNVFKQIIKGGITSTPLLQRRGDETIDEGLSWLHENKDQPFFSWIHLYDPHLPYTPPFEYGYRFNEQYEEYLERIRNPLFKQRAYSDQVAYSRADETNDLSISPKEAFTFLLDVFGARAHQYLSSDSTPAGLKDDFIAAYDGELAFVDEQVRRILRFLIDNNVYDNTMVIIMADHGEILAEKEDYFGHHKHLYRGSMRIPVIMKFPGIEPKSIDERITNVDILPTLLDALGIEVTIAMDGVSYWPAISADETVHVPEQLFYGTHTGQRRAKEEHKAQTQFSLTRKIRNVYSRINNFIKRFFMSIFRMKQRWKIEKHFEKIAVVKGDWKLIRFDDAQGRKYISYELYNLRQDPGETKNLIAEEDEVYRELKSLLEEYIQTKRFSVHPLQDDAQTEEEIKTLRSLGYM
jgi:arylsulfatase